MLAGSAGSSAVEPDVPATGFTMTLGGKGTAAEAATTTEDIEEARYRGYYGWGGGWGGYRRGPYRNYLAFHPFRPFVNVRKAVFNPFYYGPAYYGGNGYGGNGYGGYGYGGYGYGGYGGYCCNNGWGGGYWPLWHQRKPGRRDCAGSLLEHGDREQAGGRDYGAETELHDDTRHIPL